MSKVVKSLKEAISLAGLKDGMTISFHHHLRNGDQVLNLVLQNISDLLRRFLNHSSLKYVVFCWVMHEQRIINSIIEKLDTKNCTVHCISLIVNEKCLRDRLSNDIEKGIRTADILERSIARIPLYQALSTIKIDTNNKTVAMIADEIKHL